MKIILAALLFFYFIPVHAQNQYVISGTVTDSETALPIAAASVTIQETGTGGYTDDEGFFHIHYLRRGRYHLHFNAFGYETVHLDIRLDSADLQLRIQMKPTALELKQIVIEGEYLKTREEKRSLSANLADQDFILKAQGNTLAEALEKIPGVNSINTGVGISKPVIRGMFGNRIIVTESGIKQEGQQWGIDHGLEIDQNEAGTVEILKGPTSLLYGSDGMGGIISIKPAGPPPLHTIAGSLRTFYKSNNGLYGIAGTVSGRKLKNWYRVSYSRQDYGDYRVPADTFTYLNFKLPIHDQRLKNTAGNIESISVTAGTLRSWGKSTVKVSNFRQKAGFFAGAIGIPGAYSLRDDGNPRDIALPSQQTDHFKIVVNNELFINQNWLELDLAYQNNNRSEHSYAHSHNINQSLPDSDIAHHWILQTGTLNAMYHYAITDNLNLISGISNEWRHNSMSGFEFLLPRYQSRTHGLFTFARYDASPALTINGGLRFDAGYYAISGFSEIVRDLNEQPIDTIDYVSDIDRLFYNWSGAIGASWVSQDNHWNIKVNAGRAFRLPSIPELSVNGVHHGTSRHEKGDSLLNPERGYQLDLALRYLRRNLIFQLSPFFNYYLNYIYLRPTVSFSPLPDGGQIYQYTQSQAYYSGAEGTIEWHPLSWIHAETGAEYLYTYNPESGLPLPFIPPFSIRQEVELTLVPALGPLISPYLALAYQWTAAQNRVDRNEKTTPSYQLVNCALGSGIRIGNQVFNILIGVNNLFNEQYLKHTSRYRILSIPEQGRNFMISIAYPLEKTIKRN